MRRGSKYQGHILEVFENLASGQYDTMNIAPKRQRIIPMENSRKREDPKNIEPGHPT